IFTEVSPRIVEPQIVYQGRRDDVVKGQQELTGVTVNAAVSVDVVAGASDAHRRGDGVAEIGFEVISKVVVESQRVPRLVLDHGPLQKIISDVAGIKEVTSCGWHLQQDLFCNRVDELRRDDVQ